MVEKFYAYLEKEGGTGEIVDVYQAIKLVYKDAKIVTKPKEKCPLFDIETLLKVSPVRAKKPYFKYYSDEVSPLVGISSMLEYTTELKTYIRAFEDIQVFKVEEWEKSPVTIYPKKMHKLKRIDTSDSFVVLKFLVELRETKPYSYFYKYNGYLGLEFTVTSQPEPIKCRELGEQGVPLFRSALKFPEWINVPEEISDELELEAIATEIKNTYQNRNYRLQGEFLNEAVNFPDYKEKFTILNDFERQCEELRKEKERYEQAIALVEKQLTSLKADKERESQLVDDSRKLLEEYQHEIAHYERLKDENKELTLKNGYLKDLKKDLVQTLTKKKEELTESKKATNRLEIDNTILKREEQRLNEVLTNTTAKLNKANSEYFQVRNQLKEIENKGFFKNIFRKKSK